jgi:hypothetical protein
MVLSPNNDSWCDITAGVGGLSGVRFSLSVVGLSPAELAMDRSQIHEQKQ